MTQRPAESRRPPFPPRYSKPLPNSRSSRVTVATASPLGGDSDEERALVECRLAIARRAFRAPPPWTAAALAMYERLGSLDIEAISARRRLAMSQNRRKGRGRR
jgi:hypothetical protein